MWMWLAGAALGAEDYDYKVSATLSPILLVIPMVEATVEGRLSEDMGLAGIAGVGSTSGYAVWDIGASYRYYPIGSFDHGMQLGAEASYTDISDPDGVVSGSGLAAGPFAGYKIAARFGLTFEGQLGAQYITARASSSDGGSGSNAGIGPLLNLNLGWSF